MAANARSRSTVIVRSSPSGSASRRSSGAILSGEHPGEGRTAAAAEGDAEPICDRRAKVGERRTPSERNRPNPGSQREERNALARMVGGWRRRVVAVVGGNEEQIVLS